MIPADRRLHPERPVELTIDGRAVTVPEGSTILEACRQEGHDTPTLCFLENLTPVNVCRVCVVEVEGSRVLVPACSRPVEPKMKVSTDSERVRLSRRMVLEFLASSVDLSCASPDVRRWMERYGARPERYGPPAAPLAGEDGHARDRAHPGHHGAPSGATATVAQPVKVDNDLYIRDYARCILCYKCVQACGVEAQNTFAIAVAGRGFDARISTELATPLPESACVYCGNCIGVCPTGALMFKTRARSAAGGPVGRVAADRHRDDLPLLRRRLHAGAPRAGQRDRARDLAARQRGRERTSLYQGPVRLAARAAAGGGAMTEDRITRLDVPVAEASKVIMRLGVGSKELLGKTKAAAPLDRRPA